MGNFLAKQGRKLGLLIVFLFSLLTIVSLVRPGFFWMHDDMQVMRLHQLEKCFADGQIPCRWVPDQGYGYGYPQFNFYGPLPYYLMYFFRLLGFSLLTCVKIGFGLSFIFSALAMYALGVWLWGTTGGVVTAIAYLFAPYRAMDAYVRGAMGEIWAFVFLPLIFLGIGRWVKEKGWQNLVILALGLAGLFMSHNVTTLITIPFGVGWGLFWLVKTKNWSRIKGLILAGTMGFGLAAFFLLPAFLEKQFVHVETMLMGYFNYLAHFVSLPQLLFGTRWGTGSSLLGPNEQLSLTAGPLFWLLALCSLIGVFVKKETKKGESIRHLAIFLAVGWLVSLFFIHQTSSPIWQAVPFLKWLQFPWRFLVMVVFLQSVLAGLFFTLLPKRKNRLWLAALFAILILVTNLTFFKPNGWIEMTDEVKLSGPLWEEQQKISIFDYLPKTATRPPDGPAPDQPWAVEGEVGLVEFEKGTDWQTGEVQVISESAQLRLPLYSFPGMKVWVDQRPAVYTDDNFLGLITFPLSQGQHSFEVKLTNTLPRWLGNGLSLVSFGGLVLFIFSKKIRLRIEKILR